MILAFPPCVANDNQPREVWTCRECDSAAFLLQYENGGTTIRCAACNADVTPQIAPGLIIGVDLSGGSNA